MTVVATVVSPLVFALGVQALPATDAGPTPAPARVTAPSPRGATLWVNPENPAQAAAVRTRPTRPADAVLLRKIGARPQSTWLGDWLTPTAAQALVADRSRRAATTGTVPVLVLYAVPVRDCGGYSRGGVDSPAAYRAWVDGVARGLATRRAVVVVEPDALAGMDCLPAAKQKDRLAMLAYAVDRLRRNPNASIYLDAGNANWKPADVMAARLRAAGVERARGIALNVANFDTTDAEIAYGRAVGAALGRRLPLVVDTSRNGNGRWDGPERWCNPPGRALGRPPTTTHPDPLVDALLWVKTPGLSDGTCKGGPPAGQWWQPYAVGLARDASW